MKKETAGSAGTPAGDAPRCRYLTPTGRRCRSSASGPHTGFCARHAATEAQRYSANLAPSLIGDGGLQSAEGIHHSLAELYALLAKDRVSPRRAAVLAYIGNLLIRTLSAMDEERDGEKAAPVYIWNIPGPLRETQPAQASSGPDLCANAATNGANLTR